MIPRILEYEEGRIKVTAEAYAIPEINKIIQKYDYENCEAYLTYVAYLSYPDSPYINLPENERTESALFDVKETFGEFDENDALIPPAVEKLQGLYKSAAVLAADEMEQELHRWRIYLRDTPMGGEMKDRISIVDKFEKVAASAANLRKIADDEIGGAMKGNNELGAY
jgi:hypothetical protein